MASLLWGGFFLLILGYVMVARLVLVMSIRHQISAKWPLSILPAVPDEGHEVAFIFEGLQHLPNLPAMNWFVEVTGFHSAGRSFRGESLLARPAPCIATVLVLRGSYRLQTRLILRDRLGFSRWSKLLSDNQRLRVRPRALTSATVAVPEVQGELPHRTQSRQRGNNLIEARPYVPGDDTRRLHWQLWAHSGTPFVRVAEEVPMATGLTIYLVDDSVPLAVSPTEAEHWLDLRAAAVLGVLRERQRTGRSWILVVPGWPEVGWAQAQDDASFAQAQDLLAQLTPQEPADVRFSRGPILLVSGPGCPGLERLSRLARTNGLATRPFIVSGPPPTQRVHRSWWRRSGV